MKTARMIATEQVLRDKRLSINAKNLFNERRFLLSKTDVISHLQLTQLNKYDYP